MQRKKVCNTIITFIKCFFISLLDCVNGHNIHTFHPSSKFHDKNMYDNYKLHL